MPLPHLAPMPSTRRSIVARVPNTGRARHWHAPNRAGDKTEKQVACRNGRARLTISGRRAVGRPPLDPGTRSVEGARRAFEADEFERMDAGPLENCLQAGRQKIGLNGRSRHIAAMRAGDDDWPIVQQADFAFGRR
jgi:hypothetical protein